MAGKKKQKRDDPTVLQDFSTKGSELRLKVLVYEGGDPYFDVRKYYEDKKSGEWLPGVKGVSLDFGQFVVLKAVIEKHGPEIQKLMAKKGE